MSSYIKDIQFNVIVPGTKAISHKQALLTLAQHSAEYLNINEKIVQKRLNDKERISSSAIGEGIAIPHLKMRRVTTPFAMLMTLDKSIDHNEAPDNTPIDLYGFLISPADAGPLHLRRLSRISRLLKSESLRKRIRETSDKDVIQSLLMDPEGWLMAA